MSDKSKDPDNNPSKKPFKGSIYLSIAGGVNAVLKEGAKGELYPIADFYKPSLVAKALETTKGGRVRVTTVQGSSIEIDRAEIKQKLASNLTALRAFYDKQKSKNLAVTYYQRVNDKTAEAFKGYFDYNTFKLISNNTAEVYKQAGTARIKIPPENTVVQGSIKGYGLPDKPKLQKALDKLPKAKILLHKDVEIEAKLSYVMGEQKADIPAIAGLKQLFTDVIELATACNIKDDGTRVLSIGEVEVSQTHLELLSTASLTLATVQELNGDKKSHYTPPNIRDDTDINYVPKPPIEAINDTLMRLVTEPDTEQTITKMYSSERDRRDRGGLPLTIEKYEQQDLFKSLELRGVKSVKKILDITTALTIPTFYMLGGHLQRLQREGGQSLEALVIPNMSITDFMRINPRFDTPKVRAKGIKPEHKEANINALDLLRRLQYPINEPIKKNGKTVGYRLSSVKVYDYTLVTKVVTQRDKDGKEVPVLLKDETGKEYEKTEVTSIEDLRYSHDFLAKYNRIIALPFGDGFYALTEITHQQLDILLQAELTSRANIKNTVDGKPLIIEVKDLKKVYKNYSLYNLHNTITTGLNKLVEMGEIGKWHTGAGDQTIANKPLSQTLHIYPAEIHKALITSDERAVIKQEQTRRLRDLKSLITVYRNDLKTTADSTNHLAYLAQDLKIQLTELTAILAKAKPISDELSEAINKIYADYKD